MSQLWNSEGRTAKEAKRRLASFLALAYGSDHSELACSTETSGAYLCHRLGSRAVSSSLAVAHSMISLIHGLYALAPGSDDSDAVENSPSYIREAGKYNLELSKGHGHVKKTR
jgi:hypothetical protein